MTPEKIAIALMSHVYTRLTCIIGHDVQDNITDGYVLDTLYARHAVRACDYAAGFWVILGHPEGWTQMDEHDEEVLDRLRHCVGTAPIRVFIAGEDIGCLEISEKSMNHVQKERKESNMTPEKIAIALMSHVYTRLTCVIGHDAQDNITDGYVLDTLYARHAVRACSHASGYWVILGHPEGWMQIDEFDEEALDRLRRCVGTAPIRVFIAGEDIGCLEISE